MMITPSLAPRVEMDLSKPFGPVFWGIILNLIAFGMTLIQALSYLRTASKDRLVIKLSAIAMILLDMVSTFLIVAVFWVDLVVDFGRLEQFRVTSPNIGAECVISAFIAFLAQIYFIVQLRHVKPSGLVANITIYLIGALSIIGLVFGVACAAVMLLNPATPHYNLHFQVVFGGSKGANALCDILATIMMCKYLSDSKTGMKSTENLLDTLTKIFMHRGALVMLVQVFTFVMFFAFPGPQYWLAPHMLLTKVYVNTFFAILNSRAYLREKHLGSSNNMSSNMSTFRVHTSDTKVNAPMSFATNSAVITKEISVEHDHGYSI